MADKLSYHDIVDYSVADPAKVLAQKAAQSTAKNLPFGFSEVPGTRGESAYVFNMGETYGALVQEGLGTKSLIAQSIYADTGISHFASIAQDTVATFINDLVSVGATPVVSNAYWSSGSYQWLADRKLTEDFIEGWREACDAAKIVWGGGETQALSGVVQEGVLELAGCAFGVIKDKRRLVSEKNLQPGDAIILLEANGVHANGISLAREIADKLPKGYQSLLTSGKTFGEALLAPTHLYAAAVEAIFEAGIDVHYLSNITGHGWRKLMRATADFTYDMDVVPPVDEVFEFIADQSGNNKKEMYGNYNMGAGYAVYVSVEQTDAVCEVAEQCGLKAWAAGEVKTGPKQVIIQPEGLTYAADTLGLR